MHPVQHEERQPASPRGGTPAYPQTERPKWRPFVNISFSRHHHDSWKHFLDLAYWNVELGE